MNGQFSIVVDERQHRNAGQIECSMGRFRLRSNIQYISMELLKYIQYFLSLIARPAHYLNSWWNCYSADTIHFHYCLSPFDIKRMASDIFDTA